jgi:hypothetical protein
MQTPTTAYFQNIDNPVNLDLTPLELITCVRLPNLAGNIGQR